MIRDFESVTSGRDSDADPADDGAIDMVPAFDSPSDATEEVDHRRGAAGPSMFFPLSGQ